jgi:MoxR-like ATPase
VLPDDVQSLAVSVLAHRLLPTAQAQLNRRAPEQVVAEIVQRVPVPDAAAGAWPPPPAGRPQGAPDGL